MESESPGLLNSRKKLINVSNLRVNFQSSEGLVQAVRDVSFYIRTGEIIGVVGESGSGKTVTVSSLLGWIRGAPGIVSGRIEYFDRDQNKQTILDIEADRLDQNQQGRRRISDHTLDKRFAALRKKDLTLVFQEPKRFLHPFWNVERHFIQIQETVNNKDKHWHTKYLSSVGLHSEILNKYPHELSGGMNQRLMIALALAREPRLLIADEMTTGLDVTTQVTIAGTMKKLVESEENRQRALILVSHDISFVIKIVNVLMVMYAGEIVEFGPAELFFDKDQEDNHPYTNALINVYRSTKHTYIEGDVPSTLFPSPGCPFADRNCPVKKRNEQKLGELCRHDRPTKYFIGSISEGHWVRCHKFSIAPWRDLVADNS